MLYLRTGSRYENPQENGLSHFLEHMLFRGTSRHPSAHELAAAFESLGTTLEASTAADHGCLSVAVPFEKLDEVMELLQDVVKDPALVDMELERSIIVEEIHEEQNEEGRWIDPGTLTRLAAFEGSRLSQPIIGPLGNVQSFTKEQVQAHHRATYVGAELVAAVAGPCDPDRVTARLHAAFGTLDSGTVPSNTVRSSNPHSNTSIPAGPRSKAGLENEAPPAQTAPRYQHVKQPGSSQTSVTVAYRALGRHDPDEPALELLMRVIDDGLSTRLYHRLCDQAGLCYSVAGSYESYADVGLIEFEAEPAHHNAPRVIEELGRLTADLASTLVSEEEFDRARQRMRWQFESLADDVFDTTDYLATTTFENTGSSPEERLERLLAVSREDLRRVAARLFRAECRSVVTVGSPSARIIQRLERMARG